MAIVIPAEGAILERVLDTAHPISSGGLSRHPYTQFGAAQMRTPWGRSHQRRFALVERNDLLASATRYDLAAIFNQRPPRVCGIGEILPEPTLPTGGRRESSRIGCSSKRHATERRWRSSFQTRRTAVRRQRALLAQRHLLIER